MKLFQHQPLPHFFLMLLQVLFVFLELIFVWHQLIDILYPFPGLIFFKLEKISDLK